MTDSIRTLVFVAVAAVSLLVAWGVTGFSDFTAREFKEIPLNQEFYPDFKDPTVPDQIKVVTFDESSAAIKNFEVKLADDKWTIPSHHNYPADAKERLAKTAASALGIVREEIRSDSAVDHVELGVVDPAAKETKQLKGFGRRLTLSSKGAPVFDLIIGKQIESRPGYYFVRKPNEKNTYVAKVDIDLSTKFYDWVETDLLKFDRDDLRQVKIRTDRVDTETGTIVPGDMSEVSREKSADPWKLAGLDEKAEELDTSKVNDIVNTLDSLKLTGVRPKPAALKAALKGEGGGADPRIRLDMQEKGYFLHPQAGIVPAEGELLAMTSKGVMYVLQFGYTFNSEEFDVETGLPSKTDAKKDADKKDAEDEKDDAKADEGKTGGRYLFVRAAFNEESIPGKPTPPVKPGEAPAPPADTEATPDEAKPDAPKTEEPKTEEPKTEEPKTDAPKTEEKPATPPAAPAAEEKKEEPKSEDGSNNGGGQDEPKTDEKTEDKPATEAKPADKPEAKPADKPEAKPDDKPEAKPADKPESKPTAETPSDEEKKPTPETKSETTTEEPATQGEPKTEAKPPVKTAEQIQKEYEQAQKKYEADLTAWKTKVAEGREEAEKLNRRFADWYYVISADDFSKLRLARKDLVKSKTPAIDATKTPPAIPGTEATTPDTPATEAPKTDTPKTDTPDETPAKPTTEAPKTEEKKPAAEPKQPEN